MFLRPADYLNDTADARKGINEARESDGGNAGSTLFSLSRRERGRGFVCRPRRVYNACTICGTSNLADCNLYARRSVVMSSPTTRFSNLTTPKKCIKNRKNKSANVASKYYLAPGLSILNVVIYLFAE